MLRVPILIPAGSVATVDLRLDPLSANQPGATSQETLRLSFVSQRDPHCSHDGISHWSGATGREIVADAPPPGTDAVVASALTQLGRQYCWGGKGYTPCSGCAAGSGCVTPPCASLPCFDCSGLTWWAYQEHGVATGHGTVAQAALPPVSIAEVRPGDLLNFPGHVGLYVGDVDGDGTGDMVHAANYPAGVVIDKDVLNPNGYWRGRLTHITRPPRGGA